MASIVYNSFCYDLCINTIKVSADTFYMMLVTSSYNPTRSHSKRIDITNEVVGSGYSSGGKPVSLNLQPIDNNNNDVEIHFNPVSWTDSTITARGAVIYKRRAGNPNNEELVQYLDFGIDKSSENGEFTVTMLDPLKFQYL